MINRKIVKFIFMMSIKQLLQIMFSNNSESVHRLIMWIKARYTKSIICITVIIETYLWIPNLNTPGYTNTQIHKYSRSTKLLSISGPSLNSPDSSLCLTTVPSGSGLNVIFLGKHLLILRVTLDQMYTRYIFS